MLTVSLLQKSLKITLGSGHQSSQWGIILSLKFQVDGDTDTSGVQEEFNRMVLMHTEHLKKTGGMIVPESQQHPTQALFEAQIHDLEDPIPAAQPVLQNGIPPVMNGGPRNMMPNGIPRTIQNGLIGGVKNIRNIDRTVLPPTRPSRDTIRDMYADVESYPMNAHI